HEVCDQLDDTRLGDAVGQLRDDELLLAVAERLPLHARAHDDAAAARAVCALDAIHAHDEAAGGEVRALDVPHELVHRAARLGDQVFDGGGDLAQVVGRDVGGPAHGYAAGAVDQQVGQLGRQDRRLLQPIF